MRLGLLDVLKFAVRSEEHTSESSHSQISYAVFCLKKKKALQHSAQSLSLTSLRPIMRMTLPLTRQCLPGTRLHAFTPSPPTHPTASSQCTRSLLDP